MIDEKHETPCIKHNCSICCHPVKFRYGFKQNKKDELNSLPFRDRDEIVAPESSIEKTRLETYDCENYDEATGLCKDYENRPQICRDTKCEAFDTEDETEQKRIIEEIKEEKYIPICKKK